MTEYLLVSENLFDELQQLIEIACYATYHSSAENVICMQRLRFVHAGV